VIAPNPTGALSCQTGYQENHGAGVNFGEITCRTENKWAVEAKLALLEGETKLALG